MQNAPPQTLFGAITDFLATRPTPEEIIAYQLPDYLQRRATELLDRNQADHLTAEERDEMMDYVRMDTMLLSLKAKMNHAG